MTREEKEQIGKYIIQVAKSLADGCYQQEMLLKAAHIIDEALEQESVIDEIRIEIEQIEINGHIRDVECFNAGINTALKIIDKYKAESE